MNIEENIFEIGDRVVSDSAPSAMIMTYGDGCEDHFILRHTTDKEDLVGHRL